MGKGRDKRFWVQALFAFTTNANIQGFLKGRIYKGPLKNMCVPGLNCYSCPGALGACPVGAMQAVAGSTKYGISMYVLGFLVFVGILLGRFVCGWLCPFGWIQELLHKIPVKKIRVPAAVNNCLKWVKYAVLLLAVILLPMALTDRFGISTPYFCKYICPAGTLEGGIPLLLADPTLREIAGALFQWKLGVMAVILGACMVVHRPFCRYLCPLGAFYSVFNRFSFYQMNLDASKCVGCKKCEKVCPMAVEVTKNCNDPECIRCGKCREVCPVQAISSGFRQQEACGSLEGTER